MNRTIILTDLTRFSNPAILCSAGIDTASGDCIRPKPYFKYVICKSLQVQPGHVVTGFFTPTQDRSRPHQEDYEYKDLHFHQPCSSEEFKRVLNMSLYPSIAEGLEIDLEPGKRCVPVSHTGPRSLITIKINPSEAEIVHDTHKPEKLKLNFCDASGKRYHTIPITDLGYHDYAVQHHAKDDIAAMNQIIHWQDELYLRIGLSRVFQPSPDQQGGYWLQVNGIYTFPDYNKTVQRYT